MNREFIRNFVIISHIDHGKSTLADRFLEITNTIDKRKMQPQYLDRMALEREKGITIKMQPCRMLWKNYILNLIDTPGHVDFSYEVSRSLAAVEGAILLVDATKGIQAQTIANLELALNENLIVIPAINKIDIANSEQIKKAQQELTNLLKTQENNICLISAKTGKGIKKLLEKVITNIPAPASSINKSERALIFDSEYDSYKGVIVYTRIVDGNFKKGDKIYLLGSKTKAEVLELGYFNPELTPCNTLQAGDIGYMSTGLKEIEKCRVGDTIINHKSQMTNDKLQPLRGYKEPQSMIFASLYPINPGDYNELEDGLKKLKLNDASLIFEMESSEGLGRGFRCGFLGMLHLEIVSERLKRDYGLELVITSPGVVYKHQGKQIEEPWIILEVIVPNNYLSSAMNLLEKLRGNHKNTKNLGPDKLVVEFETPLSEIIKGFYDKLKSVTSGYGSMSYQTRGYKKADLVKLDILLAGEKIEAFSKIVPKEKAYSEGKKLARILKEFIPSQQFAVPIQAVVDGKIIARETKKALRKDVIAGLYGGDYTRKRKLLEKQKKGKKKMAKVGKVNIPSEVFLKILKER